MTRLCSASTSTGLVGTADALAGSAKVTPLLMDGPGELRSEAAVPLWIDCAQPGGGGRVGWQAKEGNRRCTPFRPVSRLACGADEPSQPARRASRSGLIIIAGPRYDRNRHHARQVAPTPPLVELSHSIFAHQPDKPVAGPAANQASDRIHRVARPTSRLEIADLDPASASHCTRRCKAGGIRCHIPGAGLQRIARRYQPPDFVEAKCLHRGKTNRPMGPVGRVKTSPKKTDQPQHFDVG